MSAPFAQTNLSENFRIITVSVLLKLPSQHISQIPSIIISELKIIGTVFYNVFCSCCCFCLFAVFFCFVVVVCCCCFLFCFLGGVNSESDQRLHCL